MFLTVTGGMTVAGGDNASIYASYALVNLITALATAKVSAAGNMTVAITSGGLTVRGGSTGVGFATTASVVTSILLCIVATAVITAILYVAT